MKKLKIAVYAICKNEERFAIRWVNSMSEADGIFVTDTGSDDDTVKLLRESGARVNETRLEEWRFDKARNISLDFVPEDFDVCVCTDLDEVFEEGWRSELEKHWINGKTTRARYNYTWSFNPDGTRGVCFFGEKIHSRKGYRWIHPVHEVLKYTDGKAENIITVDSIQLNHYPDSTKSRAQYLPLLELSVKETPDDDRNVHYLGREYMFYQKWDECIKTLIHHLEMKSAVWLDERCASMRYIARAYRAKGDYYNASIWLNRAIAEAPYLREPYIESAMLANETGDYPKAYYMVTEALKITEQPKSYISEAFCRDGTAYDIGAVAAYYMGMKDTAKELITKALEAMPDDERIKKNYQIIVEHI